MSTITIEVPEFLRQQVERLSSEEGFSVDQFFATAASEKVAVLEAVHYLGARAASADDSAFEKVLSHIPAVAVSEDWDRIR